MHSIRIPIPFGAILYRVEGQALTGIRIPFVTFAYLCFFGHVLDLVMYCGPLLFLLLLRRLCRVFALRLAAKITDMNAAFHLMVFHQLKAI